MIPYMELLLNDSWQLFNHSGNPPISNSAVPVGESRIPQYRAPHSPTGHESTWECCSALGDMLDKISSTFPNRLLLTQGFLRLPSRVVSVHWQLPYDIHQICCHHCNRQQICQIFLLSGPLTAIVPFTGHSQFIRSSRMCQTITGHCPPCQVVHCGCLPHWMGKMGVLR